MASIKNLFTILFFAAAFIITSCGDDEVCDGRQCPDGETLNTTTCLCEGDMTADPVEETLATNITEDKTLSSDKIYFLDGKTYVTEGVTLTIEPGTIIKGKEGTGPSASALVIARGAMIDACGTATEPIIFTSELDNIDLGEKTGTNLGENDRE